MEESIGSGLDSDSTDFLDDFHNFTRRIERGIVAGRVQSPVILLFFIIGLPWNALVIGIILKKKLFTRPSVMLLLNLATVNLLMCLLVMPFPVVLGILAKSFRVDDFPAYSKVCQSSILFNLFLLLSIYTVAMLSVDRVIYLKKPLTYQHIITPRRMFVAIMIMWASFAIISLSPLWGVGRVGYNSELATCIIETGDIDIKPYHMLFPYFVFLIALGALGSLMQFIGCGCIIYITRQHLTARALHLMRSSSQNNGPSLSNIFSNYKKSQLQLVKLFGAIFIAGLSTMLPAIILTITYPITGTTPSLYPLIPIAHISMLFKPVVHPILEAYMTHEIREAISEICKSSIAAIRRQPRVIHQS